MADEHDNIDTTTLESTEATDLTPVEGLASMEAAFDAAQKAPNALKDGDIPDAELPARERGPDGKFKGKKTDPAKEENPDEPDANAKRDVAPAKENKTPDPEKKPEGEQEDEDDAADREALKGVHPKKAAVVFEKLKSLKAERKTLTAQLAEKDAAIEQAKKSAPMSDEERQELQRLRDYEFMHDPEKSGKITREFDSKLRTLDDEIYPLLEKAVGMPATKADAQKQFDALSDEQKTKIKAPTLSIEELKAKGGVSSIAYNAWESQVLNNPAIDGRARAKLQKALNDHFDTSEGRAKALEQAPKDREAYQRQQEDAGKQAADKYNKELVAAAHKISPTIGEWATEKPIPTNATPAQKAEIIAHNKILNEKYVPALVSTLGLINSNGPGAPENHVKAALGVGTPMAIHWQGEAERLRGELDAANKRAKEAEEKYSGVKQAGRITSAKTNVTKTAPRDFMRESPDEAFDRAQELAATR